MIPQSPSSYAIEETCQIENLGSLLEQLPKPFGIFNPDYRGRFVEVGSFDGLTYSNIMPWAGNWNGIMVEPMPANIELCRTNHKDRPWLIIEPVACSDEDYGSIGMWFEREGSRLAKTNEAHYDVQTMKLDSLLRKHNWLPDFDLLVVDVEDSEREVLNGFALAFWQPLVCIIETHAWNRAWIHAYFRKLYRIYSEDGLNTMFVRRDWSPGNDHTCMDITQTVR